MAQDEHQPGSDVFRAQDEVDDLFASANPNPDRIGCPQASALRELARKERPIDDPLYSHLTKCSPCYREFRSLQRTVTANRRPWLWPAVAVAAVVVVAVSLAILNQPFASVPPPGGAKIELAKVELDLRPFSVARSEMKNELRESVRLTRAQLLAEFVLPVGSEAGRYEIRLLDEGLQPRAQSAGEATIQNGQTRVQAALDLRLLAQGSYQLALRREGESWRMYPARVE